jgi:hypothetical protein
MSAQTISDLRREYPGWRWWFSRRPEGRRVYTGYHPDVRVDGGYANAILSITVGKPDENCVMLRTSLSHRTTLNLSEWDGQPLRAEVAS